MEYIIAYINFLMRCRKEAIHKFGYFSGNINAYIYPSISHDYNIDIYYSKLCWRITMSIKCKLSKEDLFSLMEAVFFDFEVIKNEVDNDR